MPGLEKIFRAAVKFNASDVHIIPGEPFILRQLGKLIKLKSARLTNTLSKQLILEVLTEQQKKVLARDQQLDFVLEIAGLARFRGGVMVHHRGMSAVFRVIPPRIPSFEDLGLPDVATKVLDNHQGLILVTGATGQGKSTTLAAMVDHLNSSRPIHVLTVEDPIEFVHPLKRGAVNQRQVGRDTLSYSNALRGALREDPDVIMIGELRDLETISLSITAAETGHLVLGTLSTSSAPKTVDRIIDAYPTGEQNMIRAMLGESLKAVITQRLIPGADGKRMHLAMEVLIGTLSVANLINDGKTYQLPSMIQTGKNVGMKLMDDSIMDLLRAKAIDVDQALAYADNPTRFKNLVH